MTALEDGQENYPLEEAELNMSPGAFTGGGNHLGASKPHSPSPQTLAQCWGKRDSMTQKKEWRPQANVSAASLWLLKEAGFESRSLQPLFSIPA